MALAFFSIQPLRGQQPDPTYSQYYANILYLNPALAGSRICPRLHLQFREQWPGLNAGIRNYSVSYDQHVDFLSGGIGFIVQSQQVANNLMNTTYGSAIYSYRLKIRDKVNLNAGFEGSFAQRNLSTQDLIFADQINEIDGSIAPNSSETIPAQNSIMYPDFNFGLYMDYKGRFFGGMAIHHLAEPNVSFYNGDDRLLRKYTLHAGMVIGESDYEYSTTTSKGATFSPNIIYQQQGGFRQLSMGGYLSKVPVVLGAWYRINFENSDALIILAGLQYKMINLGYSYDIGLSALASISGGSHEISARWNIPCPQKKKKIRAIKCPEF